MLDWVYPLSPGPLDYSELRYSLRTLGVNAAVEGVWFLGGRPTWLKTDRHIATKQPHDKWRNARIQMRAAVECSDISDPFIWTNDDIYVLGPVGNLPPIWHGGDYLQWMADLGRNFRNSVYVRDGRRTYAVICEESGTDSALSWSLHTPILIYKDSMRRALEIDAKHKQSLHLRTLYGNLAGLEGERAPCHDVKLQGVPKHLYASSSNAAWRASPLGKHVRASYPEPSRWEGPDERRAEDRSERRVVPRVQRGRRKQVHPRLRDV